MLLAALVAACAAPPPDRPVYLSSDTSDTGAAPANCPGGMTEIAGGSYVLGEWNAKLQEGYTGYVIPQGSFALDAFCVATWPFPGEEGAAWPVDGPGYEGAQAIDQVLAGFDRRLCRASELALAAAGPDNWRYPYDKNDFEEGTCDVDSQNPSAMGSHAGCVSPLGVRDFQVRSAWARLDEQVRAAVEPGLPEGVLEGRGYAVWGGTAAQDTFYAPTNFGMHYYGPSDDAYVNDGLRVCADPGVPAAEVEEAWAAWIAAFQVTNAFADLGL